LKRRGAEASVCGTNHAVARRGGVRDVLAAVAEEARRRTTRTDRGEDPGGPGHEALEGRGDLGPGRRRSPGPAPTVAPPWTASEKPPFARETPYTAVFVRSAPLEPHHEARPPSRAAPPAASRRPAGAFAPAPASGRASPSSRARGRRASPRSREGGGTLARDREPSGSPEWMPASSGSPRPLDRLLPEPAADERGDRLVAATISRRGDDEVEAHAELSAPREEAALREGQTFVGTASIIPSGRGWSFRRWEDVDGSAGRGFVGHESIAEAQLTAEGDPLGPLGGHRVRPPSSRKPSRVSVGSPPRLGPASSRR